MRVVAGSVTEEQRAIIIRSNRERLKLVVAATEGNVIRDDVGATGERGPEQFVGHVASYDHDHIYLEGWSFTTKIPWKAIKGVWPADEAPSAKFVKHEILGGKGT